MVPIYATSTYAQDGVGGLRGGYEYSRSANPTRTALEECLASLEGGTTGLAFASGLAAEDCLLRATCAPTAGGPAHMIIPNDAYGGTYRLFARVLAEWGVQFPPVADGRPGRRTGCGPAWPHAGDLVRDADQPAARHRRHRRARRRSRRRRARCSSWTTRSRRRTCSSRWRSAPTSSCTRPRSTWAVTATSSVAPSSSPTPALGRASWRFHAERDGRGGRPVRLLADAARHQDAGRADGPALRERRARSSSCWRGHPAVDAGALPGPARPPRPRGRRRADARASAAWCPSGCAAARRRRSTVCGRTRLFTLAESLGGVESLIEHPGRMTHASVAGSALEVPADLVRLSVGIEDADDLDRRSGAGAGLRPRRAAGFGWRVRGSASTRCCRPDRRSRFR